MRVKVIWGSGEGNDTEVYRYSDDLLFVGDLACDDYDWLVVYDEMPTGTVGTVKDGCERLRCPRARTILCTSEPVSIKSYSRAYTRQFGYLLTNRPQSAERHPGYRFGQGYYRCMNGRSFGENVGFAVPGKTETVSAVCSAKSMRHTHHAQRLRLVKAIAAAVPELVWYGHGVRELDRKNEAMDRFRYHIAVENHIAPGHWTEKFSDAILCECLPFYAGDPEIGRLFPADSFIPIPIDDPETAVRIIRSAVASDAYERRRGAVLEAKRRILTKYNFYAQVAAVIASHPQDAGRPGDGDGCVFARRILRKRSLAAMLEEGWLHFRKSVRIGRRNG